MKLHHTEPNSAYSILRIASENNIWEMGIYPTLYGNRVSCGKVGSNTYLKGGYCCGMDGLLLMEVTLNVALILGSFPESATMTEVNAALPNWILRPINLDDGKIKLRQAVQARITLNLPTEEIEGDFGEALTNICEDLQTYHWQIIRKQLLG
jgi:hypothetical protein